MFGTKRLLRKLVRSTGLGPYQLRYDLGAVTRPHYAYLVYQAAQLAHRLRLPKVSVLEFGVAGGAGLVVLERHAAEIEKIFPVRIEIYGFDTGAGLPEPADYRDLPYHWKSGFFRMEVDTLKKRLNRSKLIIGDVRETATSLFTQYDPAPVGAMSHDMDYYSSTAAALGIFKSAATHFLPRVFCYFDDTIGGDVELYNDFTGQRLAINEFNAMNEDMKLSPIHYLRCTAPSTVWHHQMWTAHLFRHPDYRTFVSSERQQLPL